MLDLPNQGSGPLHWIMLGFGAAIVALLVATLFPALVPARAAGVRL